MMHDMCALSVVHLFFWSMQGSCGGDALAVVFVSVSRARCLDMPCFSMRLSLSNLWKQT